MVQIFEDCNLVVDRKNGVTVPSQKLLLEDFDGSVVVAAELLAQVDFGGVALAEGLEDLVLLVEDGVLLCACRLHFGCSFRKL